MPFGLRKRLRGPPRTRGGARTERGALPEAKINRFLKEFNDFGSPWDHQGGAPWVRTCPLRPPRPVSVFISLCFITVSALLGFLIPPHTPDPGVGGFPGLRPLPPTPKRILHRLRAAIHVHLHLHLHFHLHIHVHVHVRLHLYFSSSCSW